MPAIHSGVLCLEPDIEFIPEGTERGQKGVWKNVIPFSSPQILSIENLIDAES